MKPANTVKDFLTHCFSREGILPYLREMEEAYVSAKRPFSILIMDVDHFKFFNDSYGHLMGDEVLKYFSSSMRLDLEDEENVPFRFGGDEFVMVFPNKTPAEAQLLATRLKKNIRTRSCLIKGKQIQVTFSGGIAGYPADATSIEEVLDKADKALYYSKNHGRGRITKYGDLGPKELLQTIAIILTLVFVGWGLYSFRETLSGYVTKVGGTAESFIKIVSDIRGRLGTTLSHPEPPAPPTDKLTKPPVAVTAVPQSPPVSRIYLESGRVISGVIQRQDDDNLTVEVSLNQGKGMLQIKRAQVLRIENDKLSS